MAIARPTTAAPHTYQVHRPGNGVGDKVGGCSIHDLMSAVVVRGDYQRRREGPVPNFFDGDGYWWSSRGQFSLKIYVPYIDGKLRRRRRHWCGIYSAGGRRRETLSGRSDRPTTCIKYPRPTICTLLVPCSINSMKVGSSSLNNKYSPKSLLSGI